MGFHLSFDLPKAVQTTACLFGLLREQEVDKLRLIKLLYLIDRESFAQRGCPVIGGRYVSMPYGPVTSEALDAMNLGSSAGWDLWENTFEMRGHRIRQSASCNEDALSRRELRIIDQIVRDFGHFTTSELVAYTHTLPEWENPNGSSIEIQLEHLVAASGHSWEEARRIVGDLHSAELLSGFIMTETQMQQAEAGYLLEKREPASAALIDRIRKGALTSDDMDPRKARLVRLDTKP